MSVVGRHLRFVVAALGRRKGLAAVQLAVVLGGTFGLLALLPWTYHAESQLLAQADPVLSALSNPRRTVPSEDPARSAPQAVMKRSSLVRIIEDTRLMDAWAAGRGPLLRLKDGVLERLGGRPSAEDRRESLAGLLEKKLYVRAEGPTVVIGVDWPEGPTARAIVEAAGRRFLEERRLAEVSRVEESIAILDRHLAHVDRTMAAILAEGRASAHGTVHPAAMEVRPELQALYVAPDEGRLLWLRSRFKIAATEHDRLTRRLWDARIELDSVGAAFDRRYRVLEPARTPRRPERPSLPAMLAAATLAGLLLGAFTSVAVDVRAGRPPQSRWVSRGAFGAMLAALTLSTLAAVVAGGGSLALATVPLLGAAGLYALGKARARTSALVALFLVLALENPGDAGGRWQSPLHELGALLLANLNLSLPVRALRFTGLDVLMALLLVVLLCRRAVRSPVDHSAVPAARPMSWAAATWLGTVLMLWAYGLARGGDFRNSLWQCHQLLWLPGAYFVFQSALRDPRDHGALARVVVAAAGVKAGLALWVRLTVSASPQVLPTATSHGDSALFACAFALVAALLLEQAVPGRVPAAGFVLALLAAGMLANNRRLAWVEVAAALAVVYVAASATAVKRAITRAGVMAAPLLALYCAAGWASSSIAFKPVRVVRSLVEPRADVSTAMRDIENFNLLWTLRDHPLLGTGFGHEYVEKVRGMDISSIFAQYRFVPHNSVLGLLASGGVVGLSGIFLTFVVAVYLAARAHRFARSPADRAAALAVIAAVVVYLIQCYGDMGLVSWTGLFTLAPALVVAARLAAATGAWPEATDIPRAGDAALSGGR